MDDLKKTINVLKALADENRLRIVLMLIEKPLCVCEINDILHIALSTISAHLKTLKYAGIVTDNKNGRWIEYRLTTDEGVLDIIRMLKNNLQENNIVKDDLSKIKRLHSVKCKLDD